MSFLSQVLQSAEKMDLNEINAKVPEVVTAADNYKKEILTYFENVYVKFKERPKQNQAQTDKINGISDEVTALLKKCKDLDPKKELLQTQIDLEHQLSALERVNISVAVLSTLCKVHEQILQIKAAQKTDEYVNCMEQIRGTKRSIEDVDKEERLPVFKQLSQNVDLEKNVLLNKLSNVFKDNVGMSASDKGSAMRIKKNEGLKQALTALYMNNVSITVLDQVTKFLWNHVFVPIVDKEVEVKVAVESEAVMEIAVVSNKSSDYRAVFANIKTVLGFLLTNFNIQLDVDGGFTALDYIGRDVRDNLSELIIKRCLQKTIPSDEESLAAYKEVILDTDELQKVLVESKMFADDTASLLDYANNIDIHFINKKCHTYLLEAEVIMKKDLHDMEEVGGEENPEFTEGFSRCAVSKSALELLKLGEKILGEVVSTSEVSSGRLLCTVKNIFEKYTKFVPEYHKRLLQTIPQQVGLFYNNCTYIAYKFTEWNEHYELPPVLNTSHEGFKDESRLLQKVAHEMFANFVASHIKQIEDTMKEAHLQDQQSLEKVDASTEKCIRQCLRQQELLKTVWAKVLPYQIYNRTLGTILNGLCTYLIKSVVKFEDISSDGAEQLVDMFNMVLTRGPKLFTDPKEVHIFVESWYTLKELVFVLNASLLDINDRWADGKGPLALQFKPEELRQLIRALFQNTERRAALLAKIRD